MHPILSPAPGKEKGLRQGTEPCSPTPGQPSAPHMSDCVAGGEGDYRGEMLGWHHRLNGHGFEWTPGVGDGQGGLVCCGS